MDLPDCPPGAEGYEDTVTEMPKKPEDNSTKAEQEFLDYINGLKIKLEDGESRNIVERRGRDPSGKWLYLCFPCSVVCSGEAIMQTHILGKKHKNRLDGQNVWTKNFFDGHPFNQQAQPTKPITEKAAQKMSKEAEANSLEAKFSKYRGIPCEIQEAIETVKVPMLGVEYMVEFPAEQSHYKPAYLCTLCNKQAHPRTILNHMICFRHTYNYLKRHYSKATQALAPYCGKIQYREGVGVIINRLASRIEDTYGRMRPLLIDKDDFDNNKDAILQWIFTGQHYSENNGSTFEEVVDIDLINTLQKIHGGDKATDLGDDKKEPSPPVVAAPAKPLFNNFTRSGTRQERRGGSVESLSDISDDARDELADSLRQQYNKKAKGEAEWRARCSPRHAADYADDSAHKYSKKAGNYDYKQKLAREQCLAAETSAKKTFTYHEKNPEKHPLYPEEWKKFWNRRYKELQTEGKDPSKHDFKPEWIQFWTKRMKEIHEEELRITTAEIYRKLCVTPPDAKKTDDRPEKRRSPDSKRRSPDPKWRVEPKRRSPDFKRRPVEPRRRSPERRRSPDRRPDYRRDIRRDRRSPVHRYSPPRRRSPARARRSRSRSPHHRVRSPVRMSRSPLSRRESPHGARNRTPRRDAPPHPHHPHHHHHLAPSMQTVLISDDELKPDEDISPWNSGDEMMPAKSPTRSRTGSVASARAPRAPPHESLSKHRPSSLPVESSELGPPENVVATLRLLVALEDHLGSLGPKVVDLLAEALKMEKEKANSSEQLLVRESAVVLLETGKERLKGAAQAGLVPPAALPAVRAAVVRVAATLHEADLRSRRAQNVEKETVKAAVPVAGVGEVDRAQIAQQMAEALIAQGKTDVTSEELAQLVDAVIGMAEAKKREAETNKQETSRINTENYKNVSKARSTVSALQLLQSAYDDNEKKQGREDGTDAMDGLSDSDLETLLKNFNELSAEEQHSLIAYLKKLEAREPLRVERLRQYVNAAVTTAPRIEEEPPQRNNLNTVAIESDDDDDYTVEEVFKSAKEKVKEDQMRQEMEIVKKSLEETKPVEVPKTSTIIDLTNSLSSASDILALVQASIQSSATAAPLSIPTTAEVVNSNIQPKSFGDPPEAQHQIKSPDHQMIMSISNQAPQPHLQHNLPYNPPPIVQHNNYNMNNQPPPPQNQQNFIRPQHNQTNFGGTRNAPPNDNYNQPRWNDRPMNNIQEHRGPRMQGQPNYDNFNQGGFNQGASNSNFYKGRQEFEPRPQHNKNQHYGNFNPQNNFRGRGQYGGQGRGRGRGGYY